MDEFGVVPRMIDVGLKAPTWQFRDRETGPVATFDLSMLAGDTNHPYRVQCEQWKLMRFLEEELRKLPGSDIRFGHEVTSVRPDDESVTVTATTSSGPVSLTGRYVIAADGARSAVRRSLAVDFEGFTYPELFLIASTDFRFETKLTDIAYVNYIADPLEWLVLLRVPELWRVLVPAPENSDREKLLSDELVAAGAATRGRAVRAVPDRPPLRLPRASAGGEVLPSRPRSARRRRRSHQQSARRNGHERRDQDAFNLSDKLAQIWAGADDRLLDRYDRQRRTVAVEAVQQQTNRNHQIISERDPDTRKQALDAMRRTVRTSAPHGNTC